MRCSAREHDLADAERARLVLVELQRGHELARERLNRAAQRVPRLRGLLLRQAFGNVLVRQGQRTLHGLDLGRCSVEGTRDRDVQCRAAPLEYAGELAHPSVGDRERRTLVTDRNGYERR